MTLGHYKRAVGIFSNRSDAEYTLTQLRNSGFPMSRVSLIARDINHQNEIAGISISQPSGNQSTEGAAAGAVTGGAVGGLIGLVGALTALTVPGIGPIVAGGALATLLADTIVGGAIGAAAGSMIGALMGLGIPEDRARVYNDYISRGEYLVIVEGTDQEILRAESILRLRSIKEWGIYNIPNADPLAGYTSSVRTTDMILDRYQRAVGMFATRVEAENALQTLRNSGFPMEKVSVIARDTYQNDEIAGVDVSDTGLEEGAKTGAIAGGALGGITGLLIGLGALTIPGLGPILLAGAGATALATTLTGGAIGAVAGGFLGALIGLGIPEEKAKIYSDRLSRGEYLVMVNGTEAEIRGAEKVLRDRGIEEWGIYDLPDSDRAAFGRAMAPDINPIDNEYLPVNPPRTIPDRSIHPFNNSGF